MKQLVCEMCDGTDFVKQDGVFVCQTCGLKYTVEEAKKMMMEGDSEGTGATTASTSTNAGVNTTVKSSANESTISNYLTLANNALLASNNSEAENYANKIIELDAEHSEAWYIKGVSAGWQSTISNPRLSESVTAWINSVKYADEDKKDSLRRKIEDDFVRLFKAMITLRTDNFVTYASQDNANGIKADVKTCFELMGMLLAYAGCSFDRGNIEEYIADKICDSAIAAYNKAFDNFGSQASDRTRYAWNTFTAAGDLSTEIMEFGLDYVRTDKLMKRYCENMVTMGKTIRDSCSYTYRASEYGGRYVEDYHFIDSAKQSRTQIINKWSDKKNKFYASYKDKVIKSVQEARQKDEEAYAFEKYWEEHVDEKKALEDEGVSVQEQMKEIDENIKTLPVSKDIEAAKEELSVLKTKLNGLGVLKFKEKKLVNEQISETENKIKELEKTKADHPIHNEKAKLKHRYDDIQIELTKTRGAISRFEKVTFTNAVADGKFTFTPVEFCEKLSQIMPQPYYISDVSKDNSTLVGMSTLFPNEYTTSVFNSLEHDKDGKVKTTGLHVQMVSNGLNEPVSAVYVYASKNDRKDLLKLWCETAARVICLTNNEVELSTAENDVADLLWFSKYTQHNYETTKMEFAGYVYNLLGFADVHNDVLLIRPR